MRGDNSCYPGGQRFISVEKKFIHDFPIFDSLPQETITAIQAHSIVRRMSNGETLFIKGQPETFFAIIVSGHIHTMLYGPTGRQLVVESLGPGQLVGETALLNHGSRATSACSFGNARVLVVSKSYFTMLRSEPVFMHRISQLLCQRLHRSSNLLESVSLYRLESRLARFLLDRIDEVGANATDGVEILLPNNQSILAAMINVSRPKLNMQLQHWLRSGVICWQQDRLRILNINQIREFAKN